MPASTAIAACLDREVVKLVRRYNAFGQAAHKNQRRYEKRSGEAAAVSLARQPRHWVADTHFDPFYVRSRQDSIAHAVARAVRSGTYQPRPCLMLEAAKMDGGKRALSLFTIPDSAVSYWLGHRLINRNAHFFSSYTYAYRADRNAHHAIQHLMGAMREQSRLFVLEYDFTKYFDSIEHDYVAEVLKKHGFLVTPRELELTKRIMRNRRARGVEAYQQGRFEQPTRGVPQGTMISLFLANVACFELDREIERVGVTFARYADDTLIVCESYEKANQCARLLFEHGRRSGTDINFAKSSGISVLTVDPTPELPGKGRVTFLSHGLGSKGVTLSPRAIRRMKQRAATIAYNNLLLQPKRQKVNPARIGQGYRDWDLVTCINELRRYIYGRVSERALTAAVAGSGRIVLTRSALSFFPTLDNAAEAQLRALDGWLVDMVLRTHRKRGQLLADLGITLDPISREDLISGAWYSYSAVPNETKLPSYYKSWRYVEKCAKVHGLSRFPSPAYGYGM